MNTEALIMNIRFTKPVPMSQVAEYLERITKMLYADGVIDHEDVFDAATAPFSGLAGVLNASELQAYLESEGYEAVPVLGPRADQKTVVEGGLAESPERIAAAIAASLGKDSAGRQARRDQEAEPSEAEGHAALPDSGNGRNTDAKRGD